MSNKQAKSFLLLSTVVFSLSYLPGFNSNAGQAEMSSEASYDGDCDFERDESCSAKSGGANGRVTVRRVKKEVTKRLSAPDAPAEQVDMLEVTLEATAAVPGCDHCARNGTATRTLPISDLRNVKSKALAEFSKHAEVLRKEAAKESARLKKIDNCDIGADEQELKGRAKATCMINRLASLDNEKAARFFDENMKAEIQRLLGSSSAAERASGLALLKDIEKATNKSNLYINESIADLRMFGQYSAAMNLKARQLAVMPLNDPRRAGLAAELSSLHQGQGNYFRSRGMELDQNLSATLASWEYQGTLQNDLTGYSSQLEQIYNQHRQDIAGQRQVTPGVSNNSIFPSVPGAGRNALGAPSTSYLGAPGTVQQPGRAPVAPRGSVAPPSNSRIPSFGQKAR